MSTARLLATLRHGRARGPGALLLALGFLVVTSGEVLGGHACAHHLGVPAAEASPGAGSAAHHGSHGSAPPGETSDGHATPCTCVGVCHGAAAEPLPEAVAGVVATAPERALQPGPCPHDTRPVRASSCVLPFANGPPPPG